MRAMPPAQLIDIQLTGFRIVQVFPSPLGTN